MIWYFFLIDLQLSPENVNFIFVRRVISEKMEKVAGSLSGSTVLPAQLKKSGSHRTSFFCVVL